MSKLFYFMVAGGIIFLPMLVFAQATVDTTIGEYNNLGSYLGDLIVSYGAPIAVGAAVLMVVYAGTQYILSGGSPESINFAKELITGVALGLMTLFLLGALIFWLLSPEELKPVAPAAPSKSAPRTAPK